jgi:flagellin-like hook-associated protein FlgL
MSGISLASGVRQNLYALQQSSDQIAVTQNRLATGKKVNTAIDNPTNFFTSQSLNSRANDLNGLLDGISNSLKTIEAADNGIRGITKLVENAQSIARQARALTAGGTTKDLTAGAAAVTGAATGANNNGQLSLSFTPTGGTAQDIDIAIGGGKTLDQSITAINDATTNRDAQGNRFVTASKDSSGKLVLTASNGEVTVNAGTAGAAAAGDSDDEIITALGLGTTTAGATKLDAAGLQRQNLAKQFNEIREQITKLARDSGYNGINLLNGDNLTVTFNERVDSSKAELAVNGTNFTAGADDGSTGLKLSKVDASGVNGFQANSGLDGVDKQLNDALSSLRLQSSSFGSQLAIIQTRQDFTRQTINTLKSGADNLILANNNEEAANLLTLQTRQQLSSQALALASQQEQGVLRLLG